MFKVGDLVKRIKMLNFNVGCEDDLMIDHTISDDVGIILEIEKAELDTQLYTLQYPECFIKVLWQSSEKSAINPLWHWGEELEIVKK
jgi:hypothetical protein|tara:strand:+ start:702 stop:962 length:261 start_codon:yes stop_codon:yes gene_type:complete